MTRNDKMGRFGVEKRGVRLARERKVAKRAERASAKVAGERLPGCLWINGGRWNWRVTLPGSERRENVALRVRPAEEALRADEVPREIAESIAWGIWHKAERRVEELCEGVGLPRVRGEEAPGCTVREAVNAYLRAARVYYARSREAGNHAWALRGIVERWGALPLGALSCAELLDERDAMVARGLSRRAINHVVGAWRLWGRWCQDNRLCGVATMRELTAVQSLKQGRSEAREPVKVRAVPHWRVRRVAAFLSPTVARMVRLQECSGMRPGEVCAMRWEEIERGEPCWIYRPAWHKEAWRGMPRAVALGPGARRVLASCGARASGPVFSPREDAGDGGARRPGETWTREAYTRAVARGCERAVAAGAIRAEEAWTPHALRHSAGTRVRRACGLEAARAVLGHSMRGGVTDVYTFEAAEREALAKAVPAAARWG